MLLKIGLTLIFLPEFLWNKNYSLRNRVTLANVSASLLIGELAARGFYIIKTSCKSSNLKEKYSVLDFFTRTEKTAAIAIAPLTAAYLVVRFTVPLQLN